MAKSIYDAVVIGSGPNGLAAAITLAQHGLSVTLYEGQESVGGGLRTAELTLPGFRHDVCSAIHPFGTSSPFFRNLDHLQPAFRWIDTPSALAHPFENGTVALLDKSVESTARYLDIDAGSYTKLVSPLLPKWDQILPRILGPLMGSVPSPGVVGFGFMAFQSASGFIRRHFKGIKARSLFAGLAAHSMLPLDRRVTAGVGLVLALTAHSNGWPFPAGGAGNIARILSEYFTGLGGEIRTGQWITGHQEIPAARAVLCDVTPRQLVTICRDQLPAGYRRRLTRFRYGPGVFKIDWALDKPVPWHNPECRRAATVHIGGTWQEIAESESTVWQGKHPEKPFVILTQPSLFDPDRAPEGHHTAWAYCHVPPGSTEDMTAKIENQVERFATGFRQVIIGRHTMHTAQLEKYNPNYVGGDINGGVLDWRQLLGRPVWHRNPYPTPNPKIFLCSSSTPPGGGVHGMCGYRSAHAVLTRIFGKSRNELE